MSIITQYAFTSYEREAQDLGKAKEKINIAVSYYKRKFFPKNSWRENS
jgi:hypothetical protein